MNLVSRALLAALCVAPLPVSAQTYDPVTRLLSLPTVSVGGQVFTNVVVRIDAMSVVSAGGSGAPAGGGGSTDNPLCVRGAAVSVLYGGTWYPARVLDGPSSLNTCLVAYDGFGSNWDEWVSASRMRAPSGSGTAPGGTAPLQVLAGTYACYTYDAGQIQYTYVDLVIADGNRYSVGASGGGFTLAADGSMSFTGTLGNAVGRYSVKNTGKSQIDLVFQSDARASMSCTRN